jgi:lipoate-protein ligase A
VGNLNFSFIVDRQEYDLHRQLSVILQAVKSFGIHAEFSGRNDIIVDGKKFSGNAFCHRKGGSFHHGTILIDVDKANLAKYLQVSVDKIESKGIKSVRSRVCNLTEYNPEITAQSMTDALIRAFEKEYGAAAPYRPSSDEQEKAGRLAARNEKWDWLFGATPKFDITLSARFEWGGVEIGFALKDAVTEEVRIYSDAMDADFIETVSAALCRQPFRSSVLAGAVSALPAETGLQKTILCDISEFLQSKAF